jgi:sarcosine oxidase
LVPARNSYDPPAHHDCIVVGGGLLGLATAWSLSSRGHEVLVLEKEEPGHALAGSKGKARIFRLSYPDPFYVRLAQEALGLWRVLEDDTGRSLLHRRTLVNFGPGLDALADALASEGSPFTALTPGETTSHFPQLAITTDAIAEDTGGVLAADNCLAALRQAGSFEVAAQRRVHKVTDGRHSASVILEDGAVLSADMVVICAGPHTLSLFSHDRVPNAAPPSLQQVVYLEALQPDTPIPLFIEWGDDTVYGLPVVDQPLLKLSHHQPGSPEPADGSDLSDDPELLALLHDAAVRLLPTFSPEPVASERCYYDNTRDSDFILDRRGHIVVGCGTSGHGFKFGPILGELLADVATGSTPPHDLSRFAMDRSFLRLVPNP